MSVLISLLGIFGLLGMTVLFPLLVSGIQMTARSSRKQGPSAQLRSIAICIPVVDEIAQLRQTLESVQLGHATLLLKQPQIKLSLYVGSLHASEEVKKLAHAFRVRLIQPSECRHSISSKRGKWENLCQLIEATDEEWLVLVDVGTEWQPEFLEQLVSRIQGANPICVAPMYRNVHGGILSSAIWGFEKWLKLLENFCGGPVSVHGATVAYSRWHLVRVLRHLSGRSWINDDVVIPLMLRTCFPERTLLYAADLPIYDLSETKGKSLRRERLMKGNMEWIRNLLPKVLRHEPLVGLIALRRVFRVFWGYWIALLLGGFMMQLHSSLAEAEAQIQIVSTALLLMAILFFLGFSRDLFKAFVSSLQAPLARAKNGEVAWK